MDEFDRAVQIMYDPNTTDNVRREIEQRLDQIVGSNEGVRLVLSKIYDVNTSDAVKLISIKYVQRIINTIASCQMGFAQTEIPAFIRELAPEIEMAIASWPVKFLSLTNPSPSVKNSFGHLLISLMKLLDVKEWSSMFDMLIGLATTNESILDFLLRVLQEFGDEVVNRQQTSLLNQQRVSLIKDELRISIVPRLADLWYTIMVSCANTKPTYVNLTLNVVRLFISWIDINLVANEHYYTVLFSFLSNPEYLEAAGGCISELILKGMDPIPKMKLINSLDLLRLVDVAGRDPDTAMCVSKIITDAAIELSFCCEKLVAAGNNEEGRVAARMIDGLFPVLLVFLGNDNDELSETTYGFFHPYLTRYKASIIAFPRTYFDSKPSDEEVSEIEEYRKKIANLFKAIAKLSPETCISYIGKTVQCIATNGARTYYFNEVESIIFLYFLFAESLSNTNQPLDPAPVRSPATSPAHSPIPQTLETPVQQILVTIINSDISHYQHQAVQLTYFEVIVRYIKYIPMGRECFEKVIFSFLDGRGIRNNILPVRRRANNLFQRFAKVMKLQLHPYVAKIIENIRPILSLDPQQQRQLNLSFDDQVSLYEALGSIIGSRPQGYPNFTKDLLAPLVARQNDALRTATPATCNPTFFKQHMNAITVFSKGFALVGDSEGDAMVANYFIEALSTAVRVLQVFRTDTSVWTHVSTLLHRAIESLGALAKSHLAPVLGALLESLNSICMAQGTPAQDKRTAFISEVSDMLTIYGQVSSKFKELAGAIVEPTLTDFLVIVATVIGPEIRKYTSNTPSSLLPETAIPHAAREISSAIFEDPSSAAPQNGSRQIMAAGEDLRELLSVHKSFIQCIVTLITNSGRFVLESQRFTASLPTFFDFVLIELFIPVTTGSSNVVQSHKCGVGFLSKCLDSWGAKGRMTQFVSFANTTVVPVILKALIVRSNLAVNDAAVHFLIEECVKFFVLTASLVGTNEFAANVVNNVLPEMACPQQIASTFAQSIVTCVSTRSNEDGKRAVAILKEMTKSSIY